MTISSVVVVVNDCSVDVSVTFQIGSTIELFVVVSNVVVDSKEDVVNTTVVVVAEEISVVVVAVAVVDSAVVEVSVSVSSVEASPSTSLVFVPMLAMFVSGVLVVNVTSVTI